MQPTGSAPPRNKAEARYRFDSGAVPRLGQAHRGGEAAVHDLAASRLTDEDLGLGAANEFAAGKPRSNSCATRWRKSSRLCGAVSVLYRGRCAGRCSTSGPDSLSEPEHRVITALVPLRCLVRTQRALPISYNFDPRELIACQVVQVALCCGERLFQELRRVLSRPELAGSFRATTRPFSAASHCRFRSDARRHRLRPHE